MNFSKLATFVVFLAGSSQVAYGIELAPNLSLNTEVEVEHKLDRWFSSNIKQLRSIQRFWIKMPFKKNDELIGQWKNLSSTVFMLNETFDK